MTTSVDETGPVPVVKARVGWVGEPQHTRPPGWPGSVTRTETGWEVQHGPDHVLVLPEVVWEPTDSGFQLRYDEQPPLYVVTEPHACQPDVACAHPGLTIGPPLPYVARHRYPGRYWRGIAWVAWKGQS